MTSMCFSQLKKKQFILFYGNWNRFCLNIYGKVNEKKKKPKTFLQHSHTMEIVKRLVLGYSSKKSRAPPWFHTIQMYIKIISFRQRIYYMNIFCKYIYIVIYFFILNSIQSMYLFNWFCPIKKENRQRIIFKHYSAYGWALFSILVETL